MILGWVVAFAQTRLRWPLAPPHQALLLWGGWLFTCTAVLSYMQGVIHNYYLVLLTPPAAALTGIASAALYRLHVRRRLLSVLLPLVLCATVAWEIFILRNHDDWRRWLQPWLLGTTGAVVLGLIAVRCAARWWPAWHGGATILACAGLLAVLICPTAWALTPVLARGNHRLPMAYPELLSGVNVPPNLEPGAHSRLISFLRTNRQNERYLLMVGDLQLAAAMIVESGEPIIAPGGFTGSDPALTLDRFQQWVADGQLRFVMLNGFPDGPGRGPGGGGGPRTFGNGTGQSDIMEWIRQHAQIVPGELWRDSRPEGPGPGGFPGDNRGLGPPGRDSSSFGPVGPNFAGRPPRGRGFGMPGPGGGGGSGGGQLYDCRPEAGQLAGAP
jgi:4-amino-4-deoxy-L-arabinose transferase-like glycosyltransferase